MLVRIRLQPGPKVARERRKNQHVALAVASLLTPAMLAALALSLWRLAADLGVAAQFAIHSGLFSHWQVWLGVAAGVQFTASLLNRYGAQRSRRVDSENKTRETVLDSGFLTRSTVVHPVNLADEHR